MSVDFSGTSSKTYGKIETLGEVRPNPTNAF
jgi:hypothetical protein